MKRSVGVMVHRTKLEALVFAREVVAWLQARGIGVKTERETAHKLGQPALAAGPDDWQSIEFMLTLGGDGTILTAARLMAPLGIPILGVHLGRFGFIAETHPTDLTRHLEAILNGQKTEEERMMVRGEVWRREECVYNGIGLNDAVVKSGMSHMLHLKTWLGGALFATYHADGLITATPTGSTAYALSAGGPLVVPSLQALVVVPICPHTLSARPMVIPGDDGIEIEVESDGGDVLFSVDAVEALPLWNGDRVIIRRAEHATRLIILDKTSFYHKVRDRYLYGERLNG